MMLESESIPLKKRLFLFAVVVFACVGIDQWSKVYAVENWKGNPPQSYLNDMFRIEYAENHGAFLSLLANMSESVRFWTLTVINGIVLLGLAIYLLLAKEMNLIPFVPLTLVVAGGIGNLIDRIRFSYVIDYFNLGIGELRTGIFNIADMAITAGFLMMLPMVFFGETKQNDAKLNEVKLSDAKPVDAAQN